MRHTSQQSSEVNVTATVADSDATEVVAAGTGFELLTGSFLGSQSRNFLGNLRKFFYRRTIFDNIWENPNQT